MRIEIRGNQVLLDGYVNAVARDSRTLPSPKGKFVEQIMPQTFQRALDKADDVALLFNHNKDRQLGSIKAGNLELFEDNIGLRAICTVSDDEIRQKAEEGLLKGWSFGFIANKDSWEEAKNGLQRRFVEDLDLLEVSILDKTPAYVGTSIEKRGEDEALAESRGEEFKAKVENTTPIQNLEDKENRDIDYSIYEKQIELLKI